MKKVLVLSNKNILMDAVVNFLEVEFPEIFFESCATVAQLKSYFNKEKDHSVKLVISGSVLEGRETKEFYGEIKNHFPSVKICVYSTETKSVEEAQCNGKIEYACYKGGKTLDELIGIIKDAVATPVAQLVF